MAESYYEIPIYIKPVENGSGGGSQNNAEDGGGSFMPLQTPQSEADDNKSQAVAGAKSQANAAKALVMQMTKKVATAALNNYGNITGDYTMQQNVQTAIGEIASLGSAVAMGPAGIALYAVDKGIQIFNYVSQLKRSEAEANYKQERVYAERNKA